MQNFKMSQPKKIQLEYEAVQKSLGDLQSRQTALQNDLMRLKLHFLVHEAKVTRETPVSFMVGNSN